MYVKDYITVDCADYGTFLPGLPDIITAGANIKMESSYVSPKALEKGSILRVTLPPGFYPAQDKDVRLAGFVKVESPVSVRIGIPNNLVIKIEFLEVLPAVSAVKISYNTDYRGEKPIATPVSYRDPVEMYADIKLPGAENYFRIFEHKYVIKPGKPFRISICLPSIVYEGETFDLTASIRDKCDNIAEDFTGEAALSGDRRVLDFPEKVVFTAGDRGSRTMRKSCRFIDKVIPDTDDEILLVDPKGYEMLPRPKETANCQRISANSEGLAGCSNPVCLRSKSEPRLYWGEFHVHTRELSDGMGTVGDAFHYMKNVSRFDFGGISDHSYLGDGHQFLPECRKRHISKDEWKRLLEVCREQSEGSSFIAVPGYEWTGRGPSYNPELDENWKEREVSDKNVIFGDYDKDNPILYQRIQPLGSEATEVDRATTPEELYAKLGGSSFMCISHSTSSDSMGTDLKHIDDRYEPVVEIYSMHGANEYYGNPRPLYCIYREGFVRDALSMGKRLGFIAGGDDHYTHPGSSKINAMDNEPLAYLRYRPGITGIFAGQLTLDGIFSGLRSRNCYATTGERILVLFKLAGGTGAGGLVREQDTPVFRCLAAGTDAIERIELIRDGETAYCWTGTYDTEKFAWRDSSAEHGTHYYYVRVVQRDGEMAWSSPIWVNT